MCAISWSKRRPWTLWAVLLGVLSQGCGTEGAAAPLPNAAGTTNSAISGASGSSLGGAEAGGAGAGAVAGGLAGGAAGASSAGTTAGGGSAGSSGSTALCGEPIVPEPEPAAAPAVMALDAAGKTPLKSGNFDDAGTNVLAPSAGAGFAAGTRGGTPLWQWAESGAWLQYSVEVAEPGSYSIVVMYYSAEPGGIATISVDGTVVGVSRFGARDAVGEYGGIPGCCSRGHGVMAKLGAGSHQIKVTVSPRSVPLDVYGLQLNFAGQELASGGQVHVLGSDAATLPSDGVVDFYRMNYDQEKLAWPCQKSFCRVEYLVQPAQAGRYEVSLHYQKIDQQCMGVGFQLEDESVAVFRLDQAATVTAPVAMDLPCGVSRISIRDPNYVDGEFCSFGAMFGAVDLKRVE